MHSSIQHIFLDVDGVLADFTQAALAVHGRVDALDSWPAGERDIPKVLGLTRTEYWRKIDAAGADFWSSLKPYTWFDELIDCVRDVAPFTLLTSPALAAHCAAGKVDWIYKHFPARKGRRFTDFLIGRQKHLLAGEGRLLIDDTDGTVQSFCDAGGEAILFPQIWNQNHVETDSLNYLKEQLANFQTTPTGG
ncbi:MAG: hypothetical protein ACI8UO_005066 [Verrucomicrobiales bacterium]|jgi:hypothetical protein